MNIHHCSATIVPNEHSQIPKTMKMQRERVPFYPVFDVLHPKKGLRASPRVQQEKKQRYASGSIFGYRTPPPPLCLIVVIIHASSNRNS